MRSSSGVASCRSTRNRTASPAGLPIGAGRSTAAPTSDDATVQPTRLSRASSVNCQSVRPVTLSSSGRWYWLRNRCMSVVPLPLTCTLPAALVTSSSIGPPNTCAASSAVCTSCSLNSSPPLTSDNGGSPASCTALPATRYSPATVVCEGLCNDSTSYR